jgi:hypothetical protein
MIRMLGIEKEIHHGDTEARRKPFGVEGKTKRKTNPRTEKSRRIQRRRDRFRREFSGLENRIEA